MDSGWQIRILAAMRHAASYGIVDRKLLFDKYLHRLSLEAMAVYLFLILAADRDGRSFYSNASIIEILRLPGLKLSHARQELIEANLIRYRRPYWWVESLTRARSPRLLSRSEPALQRESRPSCPAPVSIRHAVPEALRELIRSLEKRS